MHAYLYHATRTGEGALVMEGGYLHSTTRPTSRTHCVRGDRKEAERDGQQDEAAGEAGSETGAETAPFVEPRRRKHLCATYDVGHEFAIMAWVFAQVR